MPPTMLRPPAVRPTEGPGTIPGARRITYQSLLGKPVPNSNPIGLSDIPGDVANVRKFLLSFGTGTVANPPAWGTLTLADVPPQATATRKFLKSLSGVNTWDTLLSGDIADATDLNTASMIVKRAANGRFSANRMTSNEDGLGFLLNNLPNTVYTAVGFMQNSVLRGLIGADLATGLSTGSTNGDMVIQATTGALRLAVAGGATLGLKIAAAGAVTIPGTLGLTGQLTMGADIQLANNYVAGVVVPTGTLKFKDAGGTVYRVACAL